jgi:arabinan endo-1,5-alpha-L-arabinosidase
MKTRFILSLAAAVLPLTLFADLNSGLVAFYTFDGNGNNSASSALNLSGNNITYQAGRSGQAASFNGTSSWMTTSDTVPITGNQSRTVDVWLKPNSYTGRGNLVFWGSWSGLGDGFGTYLSDTSLGYALTSFHWLDYSSGPAPITYSVGQWLNLAIAYDGTSRTVKFYLNGNDVGSYISYGDTGTQVNTTSSILKVGYNNIGTPPGGDWNTPFSGSMDDLRIYNRALSAAEVQALAVPEPSAMALLGMFSLVAAIRGIRK